MKTSKEMADSVFKIRDEYEENQRKKRITIRKAIYVVSIACMFEAIFIGLKYSSSMKPRISEIAVVDSSENAVTSENTHQTTKVKESISTSSMYYNTESTKESKMNAVTETDIDIPTVAESDKNDNEFDELMYIHTEPISDKTEPVITETKVPEITEPTTLSGDTVVQNAIVPSGDTVVQNATVPSGEILQITISSTNGWDNLSVEKKFTEAIINNDIIYLSSEKEVPSEMIGEYFTDVEMKGFDGKIEYFSNAKAYRIKDYSDNEAIAIKFDDSDKYYFYRLSTERN